VVADDLRHDVDLVVRGEDLLDSTAAQIRLGRLLGRPAPPRFAHHPLVRRPDGSKLSKADGDTAIGAMLESGGAADALIGEAAHRAALIDQPRPLTFETATTLLRERP